MAKRFLIAVVDRLLRLPLIVLFLLCSGYLVTYLSWSVLGGVRQSRFPSEFCTGLMDMAASGLGKLLVLLPIPFAVQLLCRRGMRTLIMLGGILCLLAGNGEAMHAAGPNAPSLSVTGTLLGGLYLLTACGLWLSSQAVWRAGRWTSTVCPACQMEGDFPKNRIGTKIACHKCGHNFIAELPIALAQQSPTE